MDLVAPDDLSARNRLDHPNVVHAAPGKTTFDDGDVRFALPRWSVAVIVLGKQP
jgi:alpha-L-arabinofuranosidase